MTGMVDIIDEQFQKIETVSRVEAHEKGLLHQTVIAEIFNSRGEMLMVKQSDIKQDAGQFVSPVGGHVDAGETIEEALIREAAEEVGLTDFSSTLLGRFIYNRKTRGGIENHLFNIFEIHTNFTPVLNEESVEYKWFTRDEMQHLLKESPETFGEAFLPIWEKFYA